MKTGNSANELPRDGVRLVSLSEDETMAIARQLALVALPGLVIALSGDLGAGKSVFARGFLRGLGVTEAIPSPTFTLLNPYSTPLFPVYHFDLYRLADGEELATLGFDEYLDGVGVSLVEWAEQGGAWITPQRLLVRLGYMESNPEARELLLTAESGLGEKVLHEFTAKIGGARGD